MSDGNLLFWLSVLYPVCHAKEEMQDKDKPATHLEKWIIKIWYISVGFCYAPPLLLKADMLLGLNILQLC